MASYPPDPQVGMICINTDTHCEMVYDGFGWVKESDYIMSDVDSSYEANAYLATECERYGFVSDFNGTRFKISMPFEGNNVDMGYLDLEIMYSHNAKEGIDIVLAKLWKQAESEIKAYFKRL